MRPSATPLNILNFLALGAGFIQSCTAQASTNTAKWSWTGTNKLYGVALGNWLVLERWMDEDWFVSTCGNSSAQDEKSFVQSLGSAKAIEALNAHYSSYITDQDIATIAQNGFNTVRIPLGYWSFGVDAGEGYVLGNDISELNRVLAAIQKNGMYAIIDLHGLPGSQNGEQESGSVGDNNFYSTANQGFSDQTIDAVIAFVQSSAYSGIISAVAACNEPIYYTQAQYQTLVSFYERSYPKFVAAKIPMIFHGGHPTSDLLQLWQPFINGKDPNYLILEDHPYVGRGSDVTDQETLISQVCSKANDYAAYGVPVAITEWSLDTAINDSTTWETKFYQSQAKAWAFSAGGVFWSYKAATYSQYADTVNNYKSSFTDLLSRGSVPAYTSGQNTQTFLQGLDNPCGATPTTSWTSPVPSKQSTVTQAVKRRSISRWA